MQGVYGADGFSYWHSMRDNHYGWCVDVKDVSNEQLNQTNIDTTNIVNNCRTCAELVEEAKQVDSDAVNKICKGFVSHLNDDSYAQHCRDHGVDKSRVDLQQFRDNINTCVVN